MRILLTLALFFSAIVSQAQTGAYLADLEALRATLQETPSFKVQIRGKRLASYRELYARLAADTTAVQSDYEQFFKLSQLLFPIRDNHLGFYQIPRFSHFKDAVSIDNYVASEEFLNYPSVGLNVDSLKNVLLQKPVDSVEGIYHYGKSYRVGVFRISDQEYLGVVVDSDVKRWKKGQIAIRVYQHSPGAFKAVYGHPAYKYFLLQNNEKYRNHTLINSQFYAYGGQPQYAKHLQQTDYVNIPVGASRFQLKRPHADVQYLLIQSFQVNNATRQQSQAFYESIKDSLTASNLILDLRNNEGGAPKEMLKYFKLLKGYARKGNLYVMLNNGTISQAERFTLRLQKLRNTTTVGQTTKGTLSYGSNYGKRVPLPGGQYEIYITDLKGKRSLLEYEDRGIEPEIGLHNESDWVSQVMALIKDRQPIASKACCSQ